MSERQKRLIEVYEYARSHFGIHTKQGFAEAVNYGRTSMSAALNGNEGYLTDSLFKNICEAFPGVFNLDYLLTGEGTLLMEHEEKEPANSSSENKDINVLILQSRLEEMERTIAAMRETIDTLKSTIVDKNVLIDYLKREILIHSTDPDLYRSNFIDTDAPQDQT